MSGLQWLGVAMLSLPFVGMVTYTVLEFGWREAVVGWTCILGFVAFIWVGAWLAAGAGR